METLAVVAEADEVWARSVMTGTHQGELMGVAPTGTKVTVAAMDRVRVRDGQVIEHWGVSDDLGLLTQLGVVPEMG